MNHILGQYIAIASNNPKKYPKNPYLSKDKQKNSFCFTNDDDLDRFISEQAKKEV